MRILSSILAVLIVALCFVGCGGGSGQTTMASSSSDVPDWFSNPPSDPNFLFSPRTAMSLDLQLAIDKATTDARVDIGRQLEVRVQGIQKKFEEEVGTGNDAQLLAQFTQASKTVVSTTLNGSKVKSQKTLSEGKGYRAYVLMQYPIGAAADAFIQSMKKNDNTYTRFRATETFKELDDEAQKFEDFKKSQGMH